jgi:hypothetical protein
MSTKMPVLKGVAQTFSSMISLFFASNSFFAGSASSVFFSPSSFFASGSVEYHLDDDDNDGCGEACDNGVYEGRN